MGQTSSSTLQLENITNDYELVFRASKELEGLLSSHFNAQGKGLHEKITSAIENHKDISHLVQDMRFLATIRNRLMHERNFNSIPDRPNFILRFKHVVKALLDAAKKHEQPPSPSFISSILSVFWKS